MGSERQNDSGTADAANKPPIVGPTVSAAPTDVASGNGASPQNGCQAPWSKVEVPHLAPISLWAAGVGSPLRFDDNDARLPNPGGGDQVFGQDKWQVGLDFKDFVHLGDLIGGRFLLPNFVCGNWVQNCGPIQPDQIEKLAIFAHGGPGGVDIDGKAGRNMDYGCWNDPAMLNITTLAKYQTQMDQILKKLAFRAKVFFTCCMTGAGTEGEEFLKAVSTVWASKEISVVGYTSILYCGPQGKKGSSGASCYPGARETHYGTVKQAGVPTPRYYEEAAAWHDLKVLPWASESTPHASIALGGKLLKAGDQKRL